MTISKLKTRAKKYGLAIRKYERGEDSYMLVDIRLNAVGAPAPMTLEQVEMWLDDLNEQADAEENPE